MVDVGLSPDVNNKQMEAYGFDCNQVLGKYDYCFTTIFPTLTHRRVFCRKLWHYQHSYDRHKQAWL